MQMRIRSTCIDLNFVTAILMTLLLLPTHITFQRLYHTSTVQVNSKSVNIFYEKNKTFYGVIVHMEIK